MNPESQPLTKHEINQLKDNAEVRERMLKSYDLILDFWGFKLANPETGEVQRGENWEICFVSRVTTPPIRCRLRF